MYSLPGDWVCLPFWAITIRDRDTGIELSSLWDRTHHCKDGRAAYGWTIMDVECVRVWIGQGRTQTHGQETKFGHTGWTGSDVQSTRYVEREDKRTNH